jgi:putative chitinase
VTITIAALVAGGILPTQARLFADHLRVYCGLEDIDTPMREAAFLGQMAHESAKFTRLEENLWYRAPQIAKVWPRLASRATALAGKPEDLANAAYGGRLGNNRPGDGWLFRGRGLVQLTGRANYATFCYETDPDLVAEPKDATRAATMFWTRHGLNRLADKGDVDGITERLHGPAMLGAKLRRDFTKTFHRALTT